MRGVLEESTRPNLSRRLRDLLPALADVADGSSSGAVCVTVNDKKLPAPLRVRLKPAANTNAMAS